MNSQLNAVKRRFYPGIVSLTLGLVITLYICLSFDKVNEPIDWLSFYSEGTMTFTLLLILFNLYQISRNRKIFRIIYAGFLMLFISQLIDALDELYYQPYLFSAIMEEILEVCGLCLVFWGMQRLLKYTRDQHKELQHQAERDTLTSLFVRRPFMKRSQLNFDKFKQGQQRLSLLLLDIDYFKNVNTNYGHSGGDMVLKKLAQHLTNEIRFNDVIARWGGEEFIVLLPECELPQAKKVAEKLRATTQNLLIPAHNKQIKITISIGVTEACSSDQSIETVIERADKHLYLAKERGRNQVVSKP
ncbi:GGDEF domain-containing protein [Psychrobium sp. 1_MG-2023]|uniref:GGDEF domain-containing protein n=1 Tax=Psychrobium sp. 1_MG-2023 TaxID=3062624 RepID=UPI000C3270F2|nr:GGDEF domain-containing protein [Psychrobium sp. 1_MG-2023]MDP2560443.1 GGDEF domain-containing protein [Psychrobium sp. 1_MG-2023]PKF57897.1 hypothetical protein CW748_05095 [Alteromonadales bacterium alter-6D02]